MSTNYREFLKQKYADIYRVFRHNPENPFICFYCGDPADTFDHCPPLNRVDTYRGFGVGREFYVKVPCCSECNGLLGDAMTVDLRERAELANDALYSKYEKALKSKVWNRAMIEEAELHGKLKDKVAAWASYQRWIMRRLEYSSGIRAWEQHVLELYPDV